MWRSNAYCHCFDQLDDYFQRESTSSAACSSVNKPFFLRADDILCKTEY